jgi:hypothetical protein
LILKNLRTHGNNKKEKKKCEEIIVFIDPGSVTMATSEEFE